MLGREAHIISFVLFSARAIAPKKTKAREAMMVQKQLQKAINSNIEEEMKQRASKDTTSFKVRQSYLMSITQWF